MTALILDVRSGATVGAMLGALVEAGASLARIERDLEALGPGPVPIALRRSAAGSSVRLHAPRKSAPPRPWSEHRDRLALLAVDDEVVTTTLGVLERLTRARAKVRGIALASVEPEPLQGLDETAAALALASAVSSLGSPTITATAVGVGEGTIPTLLGEVVLPGPVVSELLLERRLLRQPFAEEIVDPVGAAFLTVATTQLPQVFDDKQLAEVARSDARAGRGALRTRDGDIGAVLAVAG